MKRNFSEGSFTLESAIVVPIIFLMWIAGLLLLLRQTAGFLAALELRDWRVEGNAVICASECDVDGCGFVRDIDTAGRYLKKLTDGKEESDFDIWDIFKK